VRLRDRRAAGDAEVAHSLRAPRLPAQAGVLERLHGGTVWAGDEETALVRGQPFALDPGQAGNGGCRDEEQLAPREGAGPRFRQRDRIAFALHVTGVAVDLIETEEAGAEEEVPFGHVWHISNRRIASLS
jgi:hypothetical protein